ncbi:MAG: hypothetical protein IPL67_10565 [Ignavibacteria bacterium]|nr:hypothetical protein [Ignavibacteria bacterium]
MLNYIFGPDPVRTPSASAGIGHYKFFEASLLVLPVRSSIRPFFRATSRFLIDDISYRASSLQIADFDIDIIKGTLPNPAKR